jgi:hypothetical protein
MDAAIQKSTFYRHGAGNEKTYRDCFGDYTGCFVYRLLRTSDNSRKGCCRRHGFRGWFGRDHRQRDRQRRCRCGDRCCRRASRRSIDRRSDAGSAKTGRGSAAADRGAASGDRTAAKRVGAAESTARTLTASGDIDNDPSRAGRLQVPFFTWMKTARRWVSESLPTV